ncbi:MAG: hypothetical protein HKP25_08915 [Marinicaulis sp.]|nr:membrane integrity-associated transporter subunit PqiC [Marinicaulis sp.]NNL89178.1 hypothetical protein [Marinicaulis sp.]
MIKLALQSIIFGLAFFCVGCVSLLPETAPPKPRYHIEAVELSSSGAPVDWSLIVDDPRSTRVYDSIRIAVATGPGKVEYYAGAEWADRAPRLFQTAVVQTFEDSGRILSVGDPNALPLADATLQIDLRKLEFNAANGARDVNVIAYVRLTNGKGRIFDARKFSVTRTAASDSADNVLTAFNEAFDAVIGDLSTWTLEAGETALRSQS